MWGTATPPALASRFARLIEALGGDTAAARSRGQQRDLLSAVARNEPSTLNEVADRVGRGAPAVSRAIDVLVRAGLIERRPDPENRRRLQLRLTADGRLEMEAPAHSEGTLEARLAKLSGSELRALERGLEILERLPN